MTTTKNKEIKIKSSKSSKNLLFEKDVKQKLLVEYTKSITDAIYDSGLPMADAVISHIDKVFIEYERKLKNGNKNRKKN
jgi:hypothetical protein